MPIAGNILSILLLIFFVFGLPLQYWGSPESSPPFSVVSSPPLHSSQRNTRGFGSCADTIFTYAAVC